MIAARKERPTEREVKARAQKAWSLMTGTRWFSAVIQSGTSLADAVRLASDDGVPCPSNRGTLECILLVSPSKF